METKMYCKCYKIAGHSLQINSLSEEIHKLCRNYSTEDEPEFSVTITQEDIAYERKKSAEERIKEGLPALSFSANYLETLAGYRKLAKKMLDFDILLFHGSAIAVDGVAYLFTAKSGTGKSTHTRLWRQYFGERAVMVNDDKPLLEVTNDGIIVYGTPWDGKHHLSSNLAVPLKAICILNRADKNQIQTIEAKVAYPLILQQTYRPCEPADMIKTLQLLDRLFYQVELYTLGCNTNPEAAVVAYEGMNRRRE